MSRASSPWGRVREADGRGGQTAVLGPDNEKEILADRPPDLSVGVEKVGWREEVGRSAGWLAGWLAGLPGLAGWLNCEPVTFAMEGPQRPRPF